MASVAYHVVWNDFLRSEAKRTLTAMRDSGRDMAADTLEEDIVLGTAACHLGNPDHLAKLKGPDLKKDMKVIVSAKYKPIAVAWSRHVYLSILGNLQLDLYVEAGAFFRPWPNKNLDAIVTVDPSQLVEQPVVAQIYEFMHPIKLRQQPLSESAIADAEELSGAMLKAFYSDQLSRMFKDTSARPVLALTGTLLKSLSIDEGDGSDAVLDLPDCFADATDDIISSCQALQCAANPVPNPSFYEAARLHFAPESKGALKPHQLHMVTSLRHAPFWKDLVDAIWSQAQADREAAPLYSQLLKVV
jgi:hypothetical protein